MKITLNIDNVVVVKHSGLLGTITNQLSENLYEVRTIDFEINQYKKSELIPDMFQHIQALPKEVQEVLERYSECDESYEVCADMLKEMESLGYTFEYYLDAEPYMLRKKDLVELN
ncbi:hypothetical protein EBU94_09055 [bacterium]|nr:hypothetical protein [bacterium]